MIYSNVPRSPRPSGHHAPDVSPENESSTPVILIKPASRRLSIKWKELWEYRELLFFLVWRDVKVRYKQSILGIGWAVLQPICTMVIFSVIFGRLAKLPSEGIPYPLFSLAALLPWQLFSGTIQRGGTSLVRSATMLKKVYFPRLIIPLSATIALLVDFAIAFVILLGMMIYFKVIPSMMSLLLPFFVLQALATALGAALWLSALNVKYRDVQHALPFLVQAWMFASPVAYSASLIPNGLWRIVYGLNPLAGVIQGFRWTLLGGQPPDELLFVSVITTIVLFVTGLWYFKHAEKTFADMV